MQELDPELTQLLSITTNKDNQFRKTFRIDWVTREREGELERGERLLPPVVTTQEVAHASRKQTETFPLTPW